jgi:tetratricopeptide (TPR) repeat protein
MPAAYDVFLSHAWADGDRPAKLKVAMENIGLRVWFDDAEINDFAGITRAVTQGLAQSKALVAWYSKAYPTRRACQWELTAAFVAARSVGDPSRRVLLINPERKLDHIHPVELRDAKFRRAPNNEAGTRLLAAAIAKHVGALTDALPDIHSLETPRWHGIGAIHYDRFVGRFREMWEMHSALNKSMVPLISGSAGQDIAQLTGLGGIGKSLLAREYAVRFGAAYPGGVFWLNAFGNDDTKAGLSEEAREAERTEQLRTFAIELDISVEDKSPDEVRSALSHEIERRQLPCLWIVDDLPSGLTSRQFDEWCGPHALARTLITTRSRTYDNLGSTAKLLSLEVLPEEDAYELLTSHRAPRNQTEASEAHGIVCDLGCHALAIEVTGARLKQQEGVQGFAEFRGLLHRDDEGALYVPDELIHELPLGHVRNIVHTLLQSIDRLRPEGQDFLRLASILAVSPIPPMLAASSFQNADGLDEDSARERAIVGLTQTEDLSLCDRGEVGGLRTVHTLVSRVMRYHEKSIPHRTNVLKLGATQALLQEIAKSAEDRREHKRIELHMAHARQIITSAESIPEVDLLEAVARFDLERGAYGAAHALYLREVELRRRMQGPEHRDTLDAMANLAYAMWGRGSTKEAQRLEETVLSTQRRVLGRDHPDTLTSMNNLAHTLCDQGDLAGARRLEEEILEIQLRTLGRADPDTLLTLSSLAQTLYDQGDRGGAQKLREEVLQVLLQAPKSDYSDALCSISNLAQNLSEQGDLDSALRIQREILAIQRSILGLEHPDIVMTMSNLAGNLYGQGDYAGARELQEEAVQIQSKILGSDHPDTLSMVSYLGLVLCDQGDLAGARKLQESTLEIQRRVLGPTHQDTLTTMNNLAETLRELGQIADARKLHEDELTICRRTLGEDHPDTLASMNGLAWTLYAQGEFVAAQRLAEETLRLRTQTLGAEHPDTLSLMSELAEILRAQGRLQEACRLAWTTIHAQRLVLGPKHPDTTDTIWILFQTFRDLGDDVACGELVHCDLLWLLDRDPKSLGLYQRRVRDKVVKEVKR